jgi:hypothetical protein
VAQAADFLLRNVVKMQGAVRVMIASTITRDEGAFPRPGKQFGLIDLAVAPLERPPWNRAGPPSSSSTSP